MRPLRIHFIIGFIVAFLLVSPIGVAQGLMSYYSVGRMGLLQSVGLTPALGMGDIGVAQGPSHSLNLLNPALLNKDGYVRIQIAGTSEWQTAHLEAQTAKQTHFQPGGMALSLPLKRPFWTLCLGLMPYTRLNYRVLDTERLSGTDGGEVAHQLKGNGGLYRAFMHQAWRIASDWQFGIGISFISGSTKTEDIQTVMLGASTSLLSRQYNHDRFYRGFGMRLGATRAWALGDEARLRIGLLYRPRLWLSVKETQERQWLGLFGDRLSLPAIYARLNDRQALPHEASIGIGYEQNNRIRMGIDAQIQQWPANSVKMRPWMLKYGLEWTPNPESLRYFARIPLRMGFHIHRTPHRALDEEDPIYIYGITSGFSLPLRNLRSHLDFSLQIGQRRRLGAPASLRERYVLLSMGATFSQIWFIKRRFE